MELIEFKTVSNAELFERMSRECVVVGITFEEFMVKLKHMDWSWAL